MAPTKEERSALLKEFADQAEKWLKDHPNVEKHYRFINEFFTRENLNREDLSWEDIQEIGDHLHCFAGNALARSRAFGKKPNHTENEYQATFIRLADRSKPVEERFREFFERDGSASKYIGKSAVSEILGNLHADTHLFRNGVDIEAAEYLGISPRYPKGSDDARKFALFNEAIVPLKNELKSLIPDTIDLPIGLILDQFFYWLKREGKILSEKPDAPIAMPFAVSTEVSFARRLFATLVSTLALKSDSDERLCIYSNQNSKHPRWSINWGQRCVLRFESMPREGTRLEFMCLTDRAASLRTSREFKPYSKKEKANEFVRVVVSMQDLTLPEAQDHVAESFRTALERWSNYAASHDRAGSRFRHNPQLWAWLTASSRIWVYAPGQNAKYWQRNLDDRIAALAWEKIPDLSKVNTREEIIELLDKTEENKKDRKQASAMLWDWLKEVQIGDFIVAKNGIGEMKGVGRIASEYRFNDVPEFDKHERKVDWLASGDWPIEFGRGYQRTLRELRDNAELVAKIENASGVQFADELYEFSGEHPSRSPALPDFSISQIRNSFFAKEKLEETHARWKNKKNLILTGPPGTGKSFNARQLAWAICESKPADEDQQHPQIKRIQFHQSSSYEDFVGGYKPVKGGSFELKKGTFFKFCEMAAADLDNNYVMVIDEINRGNISRIFGELLYLIEADKRGPSHAMELSAAHDSSEEPGNLPTWSHFYVPENVYILGMMNTADRSLAGFDNAMRRRFIFFDMQPQFGHSNFSEQFADREMAARIRAAMETLNETISKDSMLGEGFTVGHSYFCPKEEDKQDQDWLARILHYEVEPLLKEYWFGDLAETGAKHIETLHSALGLKKAND